MSERRETRGERQQHLAAEALAAQKSGEWDPAPAGASAAADEKAAVRRREWAETVSAVNSAKDWARFEREMLDEAKARKEPSRPRPRSTSAT